MIEFDNKYFNLKDTFYCGQVFRFKEENGGFLAFAGENACFCKEENDRVIIDSTSDEFFKAYFDLGKNYEEILNSVNACQNQKVIACAQKYSGIRILKQIREEAFFSFIVSQNNNIPRIKSIIEKLCSRFGREKEFMGRVYYGFPTAKALASAELLALKECGLGYRAEYILGAAKAIVDGSLDLEKLNLLPTQELKTALLKITGVGDKVANCVTLFGFSRGDSFPVDTWIEKIYVEDFDGTLKDRKKIAEYFLKLFGDYSGYVQQYLFHAKREGFI